MRSHWPMQKRPFLHRTPSSGSPKLECPTTATFWTKCSGGWRLPAIRALARCARNCAAGCRNTTASASSKPGGAPRARKSVQETGCDNRPMLLATGGAGFMGYNFVWSTIAETGETVLYLYKLADAGNLRNVACLREQQRHTFV